MGLTEVAGLNTVSHELPKSPHSGPPYPLHLLSPTAAPAHLGPAYTPGPLHHGSPYSPAEYGFKEEVNTED